MCLSSRGATTDEATWPDVGSLTGVCRTQMCLVGSRQFNAFGSHGAADHVSFCHFWTLEECCSHLKEQQGKDYLDAGWLPLLI